MQENFISKDSFSDKNSLPTEKDIQMEHQELLKNAPIGIFTSTPEGVFLSANPAMARILGYESPGQLMDCITDINSQIYADPSDWKELENLLTARGHVENHECRWLRRDGTQIWVSKNVRAVQDKKGKTTRYQGFVTDVTYRKQTEESLMEQKSIAGLAREQWQQTFDAISDPLALIDVQYRIIHANKAMARRLQLLPETIKGRFCYEVVHGLSEPPDFCFQSIFENTRDAMVFFDTEQRIFNINSRFTTMFGYELTEVRALDINDVLDPKKKDTVYGFRGILQGENMEMETVRCTKDGRPIHVLIKGGPVQVDGKIVGGYAIYSDITERKLLEKQLRYLSVHDQLTGIYNRAYFENEMHRLGKSREYPITIICFDVDGLKMVNDTLGHEHGDRLLKLSAGLLQDSLRESDVLARTGGDEFAALLPRTDRQNGLKIVKRIRSRIRTYNRERQADQVPLSISVGFACSAEEAEDLAEVFREADDLMYREKLGKGVTVRAQMMRGFMASLEERDFIGPGHAHRVEDLCLRLGEKVQLSEKQLSNLVLLAQVHDLGNVGIPDQILFKPGPLTDEEWEVMRMHPEKGYRIASSNPVLADIAGLILRHHERWDSRGYPLGLKKKEIPMECRILAIVDAFDAMTSDRPYRKAMSVEEAGNELKKSAGTRFDPDLVEVFLEIVCRE